MAAQGRLSNPGHTMASSYSMHRPSVMRQAPILLGRIQLWRSGRGPELAGDGE
jgi:hypothetical protein